MRPSDLTGPFGRCIEAFVLRTNAAYLNQLLSGRFSGPVETHVGVVCRGVLKLSERFHGLAGKIDMLDRFPVFGLQVPNHIADAGADPLR